MDNTVTVAILAQVLELESLLIFTMEMRINKIKKLEEQKREEERELDRELNREIQMRSNHSIERLWQPRGFSEFGGGMDSRSSMLEPPIEKQIIDDDDPQIQKAIDESLKLAKTSSRKLPPEIKYRKFEYKSDGEYKLDEMHAFMMRMERKINEQAQEINKMECCIHEQNAKILNLNSHMKMLEDNLMMCTSRDLTRTYTGESSRSSRF